MPRKPQGRLLASAIVLGVALALFGIGGLLLAVLGAHRALGQAGDIALALLIGVVVLLSLAGLVLRHQSRRERRHREELEREKTRIDTAISHMSQGLVMFDAAQRIVLFNPRYIELYGMSPAVEGAAFRFAI